MAVQTARSLKERPCQLRYIYEMSTFGVYFAARKTAPAVFRWVEGEHIESDLHITYDGHESTTAHVETEALMATDDVSID